MVNFTPYTSSTPNSQVEINRRFYQLDAVLEQIKDGDYYGAAGSLTIAGGVITIANECYVTINAQAGVTDDLDTINGTVEGQIIVLQAAASDTITLKHAAGNIVTATGGDVIMTGNQEFMLQDNGTNLVVLNFIAGGLLNEQVAHTTFGAPVANIDLQNIPAGDNTLMLVLGLRSDQVATRDGIDITFNADAGANYQRFYLERNNAAATPSEAINANEIRLPNGATGASATANFLGVLIMTIHNYASSTKPRHIQWQGYVQHGTATGNL